MDFASLFLLYCGLDRLICRDSDEKNTTGAEALQSDYVFDKTSGYVYIYIYIYIFLYIYLYRIGLQ